MNNFNSLEEILVFYSKKLLNAPKVNSRGSLQKEVLFENFVLDNPSNIIIGIPDRKFNVKYAIAEWLWYVSANPSSRNIGKLAKIWRDISDKYGEVESNYGVYLKPQWGWVKQCLLEDNDTRRATFVINQPHHKFKNPADYPCTQYVQFFIRDNELHMGVSMRSNDLVFGLCNDVFTFSLFQQLMLNELNQAGLSLELGKYYHHAGSLHVYERHFEMIENISSFREFTEESVILNRGVSWENLAVSKFPEIEKSKEDLYNYVDSKIEDLIK